MLTGQRRVGYVVKVWFLASFLYLVWIEVVGDSLMMFLVRILGLETIVSYYAIEFVTLSIVLFPSLLAVVLFARVRERRAILACGETLCGKCGYILKGLEFPRCPECGSEI